MTAERDRTAETEHWYAEWRYTTLYELCDDHLWEFDAPHSFFPWADDEARAQLSERLLRELWDGGWARFVRRTKTAHSELSASEVEAVIHDRAWCTNPASGDGIDVIVHATARTNAWQERQRSGDVVHGDPGRPEGGRGLPSSGRDSRT